MPKTAKRPVTININRQVTARLTIRGARILKDYHEELGVKPPKEVFSGEEVTLTLWELMNIFGPHVFMGVTQIPFVDNEITLLP